MATPFRTSDSMMVSIEQAIEMVVGLGFDEDQIISAAASRKAMREERTCVVSAASSASGNLAVARHDWMQNWFRSLGFNLSLPFPPISDEEYKRRQELGQELFYRPASSEVSYEALMKAVGQSEHWTLTDSDRQKVGWEPAQDGYWFWADVAPNCPRLGTPWNKLVKKQKLNLLSLEEYVLVWWVYQAETNIRIDTFTWSWLRTRFGQGALGAFGSNGRVYVNRWNAVFLADSYGCEGGRAAEVVKM